MADKEVAEESVPRGADWEVVSLTASAYAAAPCSEEFDAEDDENGESDGGNRVETSDPLFMSRHFVFPPSQHENLPLEPENNEIVQEKVVADVPDFVEDNGGKSDSKDEENWNIENITGSVELPGVQFFDDKGIKEFEETTALHGLDLTEKQENIYTSSKLGSFHSEASIVDDKVFMDRVEPSDPVVDSDNTQLSKGSEKDSVDEDLPFSAAWWKKHADLPCSWLKKHADLPGSAWWKKHAASLYAHAKETNTFWSICIAAAVMGIVIIGQHWQQERWQILQSKWQFGLKDEGMSRMLGPISRLKDVIVGGSRRSSFIAGSTTRQD